MPADFLSAIVEYWDSNPALVAAGLTPLNYGATTGQSYPYVVLQVVGGKVEKRTFKGSYIEADPYRFSIYSDDEDQAVVLGKIAYDALDAINGSPLAFDEGRQVSFLRSGDSLVKTKRVGTGGEQFVWIRTLIYMCKVSQG